MAGHTTTTEQPFYKSVKKTLGVIGFFFYWFIQIPAVKTTPSIVKELVPYNLALVISLLGLKLVSGLIGNKKEDKIKA